MKEFSSRKLLATVALTALLGGCSSVPDALNPIEWYKGARDAITGDAEEKKQDGDKKSSNEQSSSASPVVSDEDESFPKLSSVPPKPTATVEQERKRIAEGLVADREEQRKYSGDVVRRQGESANTLPAPPPAPAAVAAPKPVVEQPPKPTASRAPTPAPVRQAMAPQPSPSQVSAPKLRVAPPSPMVKIPAVNPNSPRMAAIPGLNAALGLNETVVISGSGVQTIGGTGSARRARLTAGKVNVSGVNSLAQFDPHNLQGSYQVATILFANGSAKVGARDRRVLRQVMAQHRQVGGTLRIVGHASRRTKTNDPIRHKMANFQVSTARAERIANELVKMGAKANKLFVGSVSDSEPLYYEYMPSGEAGNRRTEIYIDF